MSIAKRKMSDETKKKISESAKGRTPPNKGKKMSEEVKRKMKESISKRPKHVQDKIKRNSDVQKVLKKVTDSNGFVFIGGIAEIKRRFSMSTDTIYKVLNGGYSEKYKDWTFESVDK